MPRPLGRPATPEQVANLFEFLLSDKARPVVGQIVAIDGGIEATFRPTTGLRRCQRTSTRKFNPRSGQV